ncbi:MAG: hypothetical protein ABIO05_00140 [Ferruginibacter sp.]
MTKDYRRRIFVPILVMFLLVMNFIRIKNSEGVRPIHIISLLATGFVLGVLIMNVKTYLKEKKRENGGS